MLFAKIPIKLTTKNGMRTLRKKLFLTLVTLGQKIVTRSGKIIKENRKDSKIINQQIVSKLTIVLVQQFTIRIDD